MNPVSTESVWQRTEPLTDSPALREDITADVCIIGGGIAGLSVAYELSLAGQRVVVLDDGPIGGGQTSVTTA
ncbi:MAG TPA: FAD-binding oxidoreductase, partial [Candidatus Saccharimonadales bacterium]|nr:FAD-binding oxidoreductase [Candidatus Saccharimonadales bacterium]